MQRVLRQNEKIVKSKVKKRTMLKMALNELFLFKKIVLMLNIVSCRRRLQFPATFHIHSARCCSKSTCFFICVHMYDRLLPAMVTER